MLRNVSWEKRSEGINLLFRGKDHFLKVSCSIWGLEGEVINISFSSSRLWNKAQGINKRRAITILADRNQNQMGANQSLVKTI